MGVAESTLWSSESAIEENERRDYEASDDEYSNGSNSVDDECYDGDQYNYNDRSDLNNLSTTPVRNSNNIYKPSIRPRPSPSSVSSLGSNESPTKQAKAAAIKAASTNSSMLRGAIIGAPKSGKSSLFRRLQGKDYQESNKYEKQQENDVENHNASIISLTEAIEKADWATIRWKPKSHNTILQQKHPIVNIQILDVSFISQSKGEGNIEADQKNRKLPAGFLHFYIWIVDPRKTLSSQTCTLDLLLESLKNNSKVPLFIVLNFRDIVSEEDIIRCKEKLNDVMQNIEKDKIDYVISIGSMKNCFGLLDLHTFFNVPYLQREKEQLEAKLNQVSNCLSERWTLLQQNQSMSYDEFLNMLGNGKIHINAVPNRKKEEIDATPTKIVRTKPSKKEEIDATRTKPQNLNDSSNRDKIVLIKSSDLSRSEAKKTRKIFSPDQLKEENRSNLNNGSEVQINRSDPSSNIQSTCRKNDLWVAKKTKKQIPISEEEVLENFLASSDEEDHKVTIDVNTTSDALVSGKEEAVRTYTSHTMPDSIDVTEKIKQTSAAQPIVSHKKSFGIDTNSSSLTLDESASYKEAEKLTPEKRHQQKVDDTAADNISGGANVSEDSSSITDEKDNLSVKSEHDSVSIETQHREINKDQSNESEGSYGSGNESTDETDISANVEDEKVDSSINPEYKERINNVDSVDDKSIDSESQQNCIKLTPVATDGSSKVHKTRRQKINEPESTTNEDLNESNAITKEGENSSNQLESIGNELSIANAQSVIKSNTDNGNHRIQREVISKSCDPINTADPTSQVNIIEQHNIETGTMCDSNKIKRDDKSQYSSYSFEVEQENLSEIKCSGDDNTFSNSKNENSIISDSIDYSLPSTSPSSKANDALNEVGDIIFNNNSASQRFSEETLCIESDDNEIVDNEVSHSLEIISSTPSLCNNEETSTISHDEQPFIEETDSHCVDINHKSKIVMLIEEEGNDEVNIIPPSVSGVSQEATIAILQAQHALEDEISKKKRDKKKSKSEKKKCKKEKKSKKDKR